MINKKQALNIIQDFFNQEKNKIIFRIPSYRGFRKILYWFFILFIKIFYGKVYLDDYHFISYSLKPNSIKEVSEALEVYRTIQFEKAFIFVLGTKMNKETFLFRYLNIDLGFDGHLLLDRENGNLYLIAPLLRFELSYDLFVEYKDTGKKTKIGSLDRIN